MQIPTRFLKNLRLSYSKIEPLIGDGSNRKFFRIHLKHNSLILILPQEGEYGLKEARSYYELGKFFYEHGIPVPKINFFDPKTGLLLVEDLGNTRLFDVKVFSEKFYLKAIHILIKLQKLVSKFPIEKTLDTPVYNLEFLWEKEINYFLEWYVKRYRKQNISNSLIENLFLWAKENAVFIDMVVMHRDFQSKNLMVKNKNLYLIDFQGARIGPPAYDLASLLIDPYVNFFNDLDTIFLWINHYVKLTSYSLEIFFKEFKFLAIIRLMQALAAYCKLSYSEKNWFKNYIKIAEKRLKIILKTFFPDIFQILKPYI